MIQVCKNNEMKEKWKDQKKKKIGFVHESKSTGQVRARELDMC